jgi:hypothetical protein
VSDNAACVLSLLIVVAGYVAVRLVRAHYNDHEEQE